MPNTDEPEDKTEILSDTKTPATAPVLEQVLDGVNALREEVVSLREEIHSLGARVDALASLQQANFTRLADGMKVLVDELFQRRVDMQGFKDRLEELERKAS